MGTSSSRGTLELSQLTEKWQYTDEELIALARKKTDWDFTDLQSFLCMNCLECCNWVTVQTHLKDVHEQMEWYKFYIATRGCVVTKVKNRGVFLSTKSTCQHFLPGKGCAIYENRPLSCRMYDGRMDFLMKNVCRWNLLDEILKEEEDETDSGLQGTSDV